jgi:hypothetical protein
MSRMKLLPTSIIALSALLVSAPAVASAAPDPTSDYLNLLEQHHISYQDPMQMVQVGTTLCHDLRHDAGNPQSAVQKVQSAGYNAQQANVIAATAVLTFCPDMNEDTKKSKS